VKRAELSSPNYSDARWLEMRSPELLLNRKEEGIQAPHSNGVMGRNLLFLTNKALSIPTILPQASSAAASN